MKTRLVFILLYLGLAWPGIAFAQDSAARIVQAYYAAFLEKQPLLQDICKTFIYAAIDDGSREKKVHILYMMEDWRYGPLFLELDPSIVDGLELDTGGGNNGHATPEAHESLASPAAHHGTAGSRVQFIQPVNP